MSKELSRYTIKELRSVVRVRIRKDGVTEMWTRREDGHTPPALDKIYDKLHGSGCCFCRMLLVEFLQLISGWDFLPTVDNDRMQLWERADDLRRYSPQVVARLGKKFRIQTRRRVNRSSVKA